MTEKYSITKIHYFNVILTLFTIPPVHIKADAYLHKLEKEIIPGIEADSRNAHLKGIAQDTGSVVKILESKGIQTTFEWTEGTHFGPILPRLDKALAALQMM